MANGTLEGFLARHVFDINDHPDLVELRDSIGKIKVRKFGGTSNKDWETIDYIMKSIVMDGDYNGNAKLKDPNARIYVYSAPGSRSDLDIKVTVLLLDIGQRYYEERNWSAVEEDFRKVRERYEDIIISSNSILDISILDEPFRELEEAIKNIDERTDKYLANIIPRGEIIHAVIMDALYRKAGFKSRIFTAKDLGLVTDNSNYLHGRINEESYPNISRVLLEWLSSDEKAIAVIPGFNGVDSDGNMTALGFGGSDTTGSSVARAVNALEYQNWTEGTIFRRAHPKMFPKAEKIPFMNYVVARILTYLGAEILQHDSIGPAMIGNVPIRVKDIRNPDDDGTLITGDYKSAKVVQGISHLEDCAVIKIKGCDVGKGELPDLVAKEFANHGLYIGIQKLVTDQITYIIPNARGRKNENTVAVVKSVLSRLSDSKYETSVEYQTIICVAGDGIDKTLGVLARLTAGLAFSRVNIYEYIQEDVGMILGVKPKDTERALKALYGASYGAIGINNIVSWYRRMMSWFKGKEYLTK